VNSGAPGGRRKFAIRKLTSDPKRYFVEDYSNNIPAKFDSNGFRK
jgi:hypothetical protein